MSDEQRAECDRVLWFNWSICFVRHWKTRLFHLYFSLTPRPVPRDQWMELLP